ncbi:hypothetical protein ITP53_36215 [Nonomuraea sp. K274]|uniref:Capsular polysaccharide biosynthesis protein n=1 Tax=Nonomuraea cypriaca TaxID=1187855 RepID=A0A931F4L4_9ACTN|nr:hypothetical protein [Nonomuraea cypriaca]MBF8191063.1 hypothetical protein [Nonomuraea cypriaca]
MGFWKTILGLARKKFVGPPVVVVAVGLALAAYFLMPSSYVSTASMVLTVPATGGTLETEPQNRPGLTNPLLQFNDALRTTAGILILATNRPDVYAEVGAPEGGPTSLVINDGRTNPDLLGISTNGPFVYVEVEGDSPATVTEVMRKAQQRVRLELAKRQTAVNAPVSTHIGIMDVMPPTVPRQMIQDRLVAAALGGLAGVVAGLGVAYAVQRLRARGRAPGGEPVPEIAIEDAEHSADSEQEPEIWAEAVAEQAQEEEQIVPPVNGSKPHPPAVQDFPLTVTELAEDDTGPIQAIKPQDEQPASSNGRSAPANGHEARDEKDQLDSMT